MGFRAPSKIQEEVLYHLLNNPSRNIIAQSQSGTGKTAAFSIAIISRIDPANQSPQALIIVPTYELALQIGSVIEKMAQFLPYIQIAYAVRDPTMSKKPNLVRRKLLAEPIVIGTPGTVEDWCRRLRVIDLSRLRIFCVDEADVLITAEDFQQILFSLRLYLKDSSCRMMLFSATYSDDAIKLACRLTQRPVVLRLERETQALHNIRQFFVFCDIPHQKYDAIEQIYASLTIGQAIIFCRKIATARSLAVRMANQKHSVRELTSALDIEQRRTVMSQFREGLFGVLISANVATRGKLNHIIFFCETRSKRSIEVYRGIDVADVSLIINYDMPELVNFKPDYETYLHRIGRCGRFNRPGYVFNLINSLYDVITMRSIAEYFSHPIEEIAIDDISDLEPYQD
ncbi:unnamed protein product [Rotaria sp. Silwood1]|nr:unnamed protein product [Rotaria sp. Silwood1]CAF4988716.1 unnamed protein product [Rotaria sp. Silwood1]